MKQAITNITFTPEGEIINPRMHDANWKLVSIVDHKTIEIGGVTEDGKPFRLSLKGVVTFRLNDFVNGNVILSAKVAKPETVTFEEVTSQFETASQDYVRKVSSDIQAGRLLYITIDPSIGAWLVTICAEIVALVPVDEE